MSFIAFGAVDATWIRRLLVGQWWTHCFCVVGGIRSGVWTTISPLGLKIGGMVHARSVFQ